MAARDDAGAETVPQTVDPAPREAQGRGRRYAALDLGTNSCRMLIAEPRGSQFTVVDSYSKSVQLGRGLERHGTLSRASIERAIAALKACRRKIDEHGVQRMRLVATEACRRATNGAAFLRRAEDETGLALEIIEPAEEARYAVVSCAPLVEPATRQLLVVDIGGGSTELVWLDLSDVPVAQQAGAIMGLERGFPATPGGAGARVVDWISVPLGVATLKDLFTDVDEEKARFALMSWHFEEQMRGFAPYREAAGTPIGDGFQVIGTSGTVTTVAASHLGLRRYSRDRVDGLSMTTAEVDRVIDHYLEIGPEGRRRDRHIGAGRQALILSGIAILQTLTRLWPSRRMSVADRGLREGMLYAQMSADGALADAGDGEGD